jgi:hypothetical protein
MVHDSILGEAQKEFADECLSVCKEIMERPILQIPLPPEWGRGSHLVVYSEGKVGECWAEMKECA